MNRFHLATIAAIWLLCLPPLADGGDIALLRQAEVNA